MIPVWKRYVVALILMLMLCLALAVGTYAHESDHGRSKLVMGTHTVK